MRPCRSEGKMTVISHIGRPSSSLTQSAPLKHQQIGDKTLGICCADVALSKHVAIHARPNDHKDKLQYFKFTCDRLADSRGYQTQPSYITSSKSASSECLAVPTKGVSLSRSYTDLDNGSLLLANNRQNNDSLSMTPSTSRSLLSCVSSATAAAAASRPTSTAQASSRALPPPRSTSKISHKKALRKLDALKSTRCKPRHMKDSSVVSLLTSRGVNGVLALTTVLVLLAQLLLLFSSQASAQYVTGESSLASNPPFVPTGSGVAPASNESNTNDSSRAAPDSAREMRDARSMIDKLPVNMTNVFQVLFKKRPYSRYWTIEQKWDDLFRRAIAVQETMRQAMLKNLMRDIEYYADMTISPACMQDLKYIQSYTRQSTNFRWLAHMFDSTGKSEPGMLTGMLSNLGHVVQCIRVRAPARPSNHSFDERFFDQQTELLGERFRGKYCLASVRPVMPTKPVSVVSRFSDIMNASMLSNISYTGEPEYRIKQRSRQMHVPESIHSTIDRNHYRLDQVPFESELYQYLILQRNFVFSLPRFMGVCYPSSCTKEDIRSSIQRTMDDQHQVVDIEFECEQEEISAWDWFLTPRLIAYVVAGLVSSLVFLASLTRYILLSKLQIKRSKLKPNSGMASLLDALDMFSVDKCAGILFVKTKPASPWVDWTKVENNRSTSIDALRGFLMLVLVYSQMTVLGCLPIPFMWSKWSDAMFPFYRSMLTQFFLNMGIWSEAFYMISAYIIALKVLENYRPKPLPVGDASNGAMAINANRQSKPAYNQTYQAPNLFTFAMKRYVRLVLPMASFILFNYVWPRLSNGFVMQDQASKLMKPCDSYGWTNFLLLHNHNAMNETCLWPSHVSASFFQLHLLSYPLLVLCLMALYSQFRVHYGDYDERKQRKKIIAKLLTCFVFCSLLTLALIGAVYPAAQASGQSLIVPFLIDYIDYDNYKRVIEWMVLPTYNHLTSYMLGLGIAYVVIRKRANRELQRVQASQWKFECAAGQYHQREGSIESIKSSSTQELHQQDGLTFKAPFGGLHNGSPAIRVNMKRQQVNQKQSNISATSSVSSERRYDDESSSVISIPPSRLSRFLKTASCLLLCLGSLLASWFWNGLGQPMSDAQTFWFVLLTKLIFCSSFGLLFYSHFATRQNSSNPWMITRFLVPIGRMSLTVFYVSWLVIWFDLLTSLYQWHPSHYFICEKYNEIIFITLILAMFIYGAFEGIVKRIQYSSRTSRLRNDVLLSAAGGVNGLLGGGPRRYQMRPFESFFDPEDKPTLLDLQNELDLSESLVGNPTNKSDSPSGNNQSDAIPYSVSTIDALKQQSVTSAGLQSGPKPMYLNSMGNVSTISIGGNLSASDRYKLNAELRANYSFASIGLYESAGATGDLSHQHTADPKDSKRR